MRSLLRGQDLRPFSDGQGSVGYKLRILGEWYRLDEVPMRTAYSEYSWPHSWADGSRVLDDLRDGAALLDQERYA